MEEDLNLSKKAPGLDELASKFLELRSHVLLVSFEWKFYKDLYQNDRNVEILDKSAPYFFNTLHTILLDSIILKLAKILEKKSTYSNENLTVDYLLSLLKENNVKYIPKKIIFFEYSKKIEKIIYSYDYINFSSVVIWSDKEHTLSNKYKNITLLFKKLSPYRNKYLAHIDRHESFKHKELLPENLNFLLSSILKLLFDLMNNVENIIRNNNTVYEYPILYNATNSLLSNLRRGLERKKTS